MVSRVDIASHPLILHKLSLLRDQSTPPMHFRGLVRELTQLLIFEATRCLRVVPLTVQTPLAACEAHAIADRIALVPILRAGLGMVDPVLDLIPTASVWHLGLYRDHDTLKPVSYYNKLPAILPIDVALVLDPMLATGGSAIAALDVLKGRGVNRLVFIGLIAAPEGIAALSSAHPDVMIHVGAVDQKLNEIGYIVPGLGDAGDRQFAT
jgi:uracil phosphoribosyltransferase